MKAETEGLTGLLVRLRATAWYIVTISSDKHVDLSWQYFLRLVSQGMIGLRIVSQVLIGTCQSG